MKAAPLLLLSLALVGCVTVQPCVCPTPAPKVECGSPCVELGPAKPAEALVPDSQMLKPFEPNLDTSLRQTTATPKADDDYWYTIEDAPHFETTCTITEPSGKTYPCDQAPKPEVLIRTKDSGCFLRVGSWSGWGVCPVEVKP